MESRRSKRDKLNTAQIIDDEHVKEVHMRRSRKMREAIDRNNEIVLDDQSSTPVHQEPLKSSASKPVKKSKRKTKTHPQSQPQPFIPNFK